SSMCPANDSPANGLTSGATARTRPAAKSAARSQPAWSSLPRRRRRANAWPKRTAATAARASTSVDEVTAGGLGSPGRRLRERPRGGVLASALELVLAAGLDVEHLRERVHAA